MKTTPEILFKGVNSWTEFESKINGLTKKEKGDAFELLTKFFFLVDPVLKSKYQQVWAFSELPEKEIAYLDLPRVEIGIDIIAKSDDEYHAIQCKFHADKSRAVTFKEVSTFISLLESNPKLSQGFVCAYADATSKNYQRLKTKPLNQIMSDTWERLDTAFFDNVRSLIAGKTPSYPIFQPKKHQEQAIEQARLHFTVNKQTRGKLIFPCGAGKSLTGFWIIQTLQSKSTIVAVPSLALIKQTLDVYLKQVTARQSNVKWLCICSDEAIGQDQDIVFMTENLGIPCNTNTDYIERWLIKNKDENIIIFTTYQSGFIISEISKKLQFKFDTGILDEAHKTVGNKTKLFSHLLFDENIAIGKRIFMTATERFFSGPKDYIVSMDDPEIYGDTFALMTFKEAIQADLLTDYKLITIDVRKSEIAAFIKENNLVQLNGKWKRETESRSLASMLALRKAMKTLPIRNAVSFHGSIDKAVRSQQLQEYITTMYDYAPIDSYTVSGLMPTTKRDGIVREFASSERALITNAKCLTEGVDVPNIDCIVFADPRSSKVDIVQALGRALRKKEGKEWGYVIVPVVYDEESDEIDNESYAEIMNIVQALATNDERIVEYFKRKHEKQPSKGTSERDPFQLTILSEYLDAETLASNLEIKLWERLAKLNWMPFEEAREYVHEINLKSRNEWKAFCRSDKKPADIPSNPVGTYKNSGWVSWGDWLGTRVVSNRLKVYKKFEDARKIVQNLNFKSKKNWNSYRDSDEIPNDIPKRPDHVYKDEGWISWGDWLGSKFIHFRLRQYRSFSEAKAVVHGLNIKSIKQWQEYLKTGALPDDIPNDPRSKYISQGWISWADWLGTGKIAKHLIQYKNFDEARLFVRNLKLNNVKEWEDYCKSGLKPVEIPIDPRKTYKNKGWISMGDWLGTGFVAHKLRKYKTFTDARDFVRKLKLQRFKDWEKYCKSGRKPEDIPRNPDHYYKNTGWISWSNWLDSGFVAPRLRKYRDFSEARDFARSLNLKSSDEWKTFCQTAEKPEDIPAAPSRTYKDKGWISWGDWLGTGNIGPGLKNYQSFQEARSFVRSLHLKSRKEYNTYFSSSNLAVYIPLSADRFYKGKGWISWGDFLGTGIISNRLRSHREFNEARVFVRKLQLKSQKEWVEYCRSGKKPDDIPSEVYRVYKGKGWISMGDWLGTGTIAGKNITYRNFEEARTFVQNLQLASRADWADYCKSGSKPGDIPADPARVYKSTGWISWNDWLGPNRESTKASRYRSFEDARKFVRGLQLKNLIEWKAYCNSGLKPDDIPTSVYTIYKNKGWVSMGDWLGTNVISSQKRIYREFKEARKFVRNFKIKTYADWLLYCKSGAKPEDIPRNAAQTYKGKGWVSWGDFLGNNILSHKSRVYLSFEAARTFVRSQGIKSMTEWKKYCHSGKKPEDIPNHPNEKYKSEGWINWGDFLGTGTIAVKFRTYKNFNDAKSFAQSLNLKSKTEWTNYCKSGIKPEDIPSDPPKIYKDKGWISWGDFLRG